MSGHEPQGPQPIPHGAVYFLYALVGLLALLVAAWIVKML